MVNQKYNNDTANINALVLPVAMNKYALNNMSVGRFAENLPRKSLNACLFIFEWSYLK